MEIRLFEDKDAQDVADIYNRYITAGGATMDTVPKPAADIKTWVEKFNRREALYVMEGEEEIVGWGIIKRYSDRPGYALACETAVYISRRYLGKKLGTKMKKFLLERCRELNYHHLVAKIWATNTASIEYNRRLGYEIVGRQREIGFVRGQWQDVIIMQLIFDDVKPPDFILNFAEQEL